MIEIHIHIDVSPNFLATLSCREPVQVKTMLQSTPDIAVGRHTYRSRYRRGPDTFQSTPDIAVGRHAYEMALEKVWELVSIHARHCCRATPKPPHIYALLKWFQSTPDIAVGRHLAGSIHGMLWAMFQSTPDIAVGRH